VTLELAVFCKNFNETTPVFIAVVNTPRFEPSGDDTVPYTVRKGVIVSCARTISLICVLVPAAVLI